MRPFYGSRTGTRYLFFKQLDLQREAAYIGELGMANCKSVKKFETNHRVLLYENGLFITAGETPVSS
jgi:hypothetical protein